MLTKYKDRKICLIGVGKVGSALYHSFISLGYKIKYAIDKDVIRLQKITKRNNKLIIDEKVRKEYLINSDIIIFSLSDKYLHKIIKQCSRFKIDFSSKIIFHTSGIENSDIFNLLKVNKSNTGSLHPLQTFNKISYSKSELLKNIYFGIEGGTNAIKYFINYIKCLNSKYIFVPKNKKILYHTVCVIASNFLVSHFKIISKIIDKIKLKNDNNIDIVEPIVRKTIDNIFKHGIKDSLTGPFDRGDIKTIDLHLINIKEELPYLLYYYVILGREALELSKEKKSISKIEAKEIEKILLKHS